MTFIQGAANDLGSVASITVAFSKPIAIGNFIVIMVNSSDNTATVSDTLLHTYTPVDAWQGNSATPNTWGRIYYVPGCRAGTNSVKVSTIASQFVGLSIAEFSGIAKHAPLNGAIHGGSFVNSLTPTTASFTPGVGDLIIAGQGNDGTSSTTMTPTGSWLDGPSHELKSLVGNNDVAMEYQLNVAGASVTGGWTNGTQQNVALCYASFKTAASLPGNEYCYGLVGDGMGRSEAWT